MKQKFCRDFLDEKKLVRSVPFMLHYTYIVVLLNNSKLSDYVDRI